MAEYTDPAERDVSPQSPRGSWRSASQDPNDRAAHAHRDAQLAPAYGHANDHRLDVIRPLVTGRRVLDVGCVDHCCEALEPDSLHSVIVSLAESSVAADIDQAGLDALAARGEDVVCVDLDEATDRARLAESGPFDVVVAGELIEHLSRPLSLFEAARDCLSPGGALVITTPNPFAPHRVHAGWQRVSHENVDHLAWSFPSGIAELAERCNLRLEQAITCGVNSRGVSDYLRYWKKGIRRRCSLAARHHRRPSHFLKSYELPLGAILGLAVGGARRSQWLGETALYVVRKDQEPNVGRVS